MAGHRSFQKKLRAWLKLDALSPGVRRVLVGTVGAVVLCAGIALLVLPGPAFLVIPLGLAILATEFIWARRWLVMAKDWIRKQRRARKARKHQPLPEPQ